jgi:glycosyltransferase involved in cell wall biosynthesis
MSTFPGVTVAICCHNSAARLPETLKHMAAQQPAQGISWEVLVIDNASTDNTAAIALESWPANAAAPLRVAVEPQPGLSHARVKAFHEARHDIISFIDDDNWVSSDWVQLVNNFFEEHPEVGAVGGCGEPVFENDQVPSWFKWFNKSYAAGPQYENSGDITDMPTSLLWGAGFSMRSKIFAELEARGFQFMCTDRLGNLLASSGDTELCYAIRALGWRLYYLSALRYQHFIPAARLTWPYLRNLYRGAGRGSVYITIIRTATSETTRPVERSWVFQALGRLRLLARLFIKYPRIFFTVSEGNHFQLLVDAALAQLSLLLQIHSGYERLYDKTKSIFQKKPAGTLTSNPK